MKRVITLAVVFSLSLQAVSGQAVEEVLQQYLHEMAVMTRFNRETKIYLKDNKPVAQSSEEVEMLMLDDRANGLYNKYYIYHGIFDELKDIDAYTRVPDGNK